MLIKLRPKSQITVPKEIVTSLGLNDGDDLNIVEEDGTISITQVVVCRKKHLDELEAEIEAVKQQASLGEPLEFNRVDNALQQLRHHVSL